MPSIKIRSVSLYELGVQVSVSNSTNKNGDTAFFDLPSNFDDDKKSRWARNAGFETVVFRNKWGKTQAHYLQVPEDQTVEVTFLGMDRKISLNYVWSPVIDKLFG